MTDSNKLHRLLSRQIQRYYPELEPDLDHNPKLMSLLLSISRTYENFEQDLYLLERSMTLSSKELHELNLKLETAHEIAKIGYWQIDKQTLSFNWSKEIYTILGLDSANGPPTFIELSQYFHPDEAEHVRACVEKSITDGSPFSVEHRFLNPKTNEYKWLLAKTKEGHVDEKFITGILIDIDDRKLAEIAEQETHNKLLSLSRQAGMAEVAASVLHNIGNILNSANISINMISELELPSYQQKLFNAIAMIKQHQHALLPFFKDDEKGRLIPSFLIELSNTLEPLTQAQSQEVENIKECLNHIKEIVEMQNTISGISTLKEEINLLSLIELATSMTSNIIDKQILSIENKLSRAPIIKADKTKLLQILVNLLGNANDAIADLRIRPKITLQLSENDHQIKISITDNGMGISKENLNKIFQFGFSTKTSGHGFGLHGSAIFAKEMGGSLIAQSEGPQQGATFSLTLPMAATEGES